MREKWSADASILGKPNESIVLDIVIPFWGVLLAPPLLAIFYAFRKPKPKRGVS